MNANLWRAIRGPVVLITIGTLFAVDNFASIGFDRTWPVLIIVIGIMKLLERSVAPPQTPYQPYQPYGPPPGPGFHAGPPPPPPPPPPMAPMPPDNPMGGPHQ
jgi:hypothetical protein